jgi:hypothetical protein
VPVLSQSDDNWTGESNYVQVDCADLLFKIVDLGKSD